MAMPFSFYNSKTTLLSSFFYWLLTLTTVHSNAENQYFDDEDDIDNYHVVFIDQEIAKKANITFRSTLKVSKKNKEKIKKIVRTRLYDILHQIKEIEKGYQDEEILLKKALPPLLYDLSTKHYIDSHIVYDEKGLSIEVINLFPDNTNLKYPTVIFDSESDSLLLELEKEKIEEEIIKNLFMKALIEAPKNPVAALQEEVTNFLKSKYYFDPRVTVEQNEKELILRIKGDLRKVYLTEVKIDAPKEFQSILSRYQYYPTFLKKLLQEKNYWELTYGEPYPYLTKEIIEQNCSILQTACAQAGYNKVAFDYTLSPTHQKKSEGERGTAVVLHIKASQNFDHYLFQGSGSLILTHSFSDFFTTKEQERIRKVLKDDKKTIASLLGISKENNFSNQHFFLSPDKNKKIRKWCNQHGFDIDIHTNFQSWNNITLLSSPKDLQHDKQKPLNSSEKKYVQLTLHLRIQPLPIYDGIIIMNEDQSDFWSNKRENSGSFFGIPLLKQIANKSGMQEGKEFTYEQFEKFANNLIRSLINKEHAVTAKLISSSNQPPSTPTHYYIWVSTQPEKIGNWGAKATFQYPRLHAVFTKNNLQKHSWKLDTSTDIVFSFILKKIYSYLHQLPLIRLLPSLEDECIPFSEAARGNLKLTNNSFFLFGQKALTAEIDLGINILNISKLKNQNHNLALKITKDGTWKDQYNYISGINFQLYSNQLSHSERVTINDNDNNNNQIENQLKSGMRPRFFFAYKKTPHSNSWIPDGSFQINPFFSKDLPRNLKNNISVDDLFVEIVAVCEQLWKFNAHWHLKWKLKTIGLANHKGPLNSMPKGYAGCYARTGPFYQNLLFGEMGLDREEKPLIKESDDKNVVLNIGAEISLRYLWGPPYTNRSEDNFTFITLSNFYSQKTPFDLHLSAGLSLPFYQNTSFHFFYDLTQIWKNRSSNTWKTFFPCLSIHIEEIAS